ncbi:MAG: alpha-rhamnosidase [Acholeplasmataceae bacterium]|nr:alpha-rhamnosidase [Acholeplasmataceae bacterium]
MKTAKWIWYPGDFELELANKCMTRRYERDTPVPPFWRLDRAYPNVKFIKNFKLQKRNEIMIKAEGKLNLMLNDRFIYNFNGILFLGPGDYRFVISVYNDSGLPCLYLESEELVSDESWEVTCNDHRYFAATTDKLVHNSTPNNVRLSTTRIEAVAIIKQENAVVYDFGKEMMAYPFFEGIQSKGVIRLYYGESFAEASDLEHCETLDYYSITHEKEFQTPIARAFRYLAIISDVKYEKLSAMAEFIPVDFCSSFSCSDPLLTEIYQVSLSTLHLNMREFMLDGIKRDRWLWSGDAYQSYLMDYYSFFETDVIKRTMLALFGKTPIKTHINHIMDYSFYWLMAFDDYYRYTGDSVFIDNNFPKILEMLDFCLSRTNKNGLMEGLPGDWVFVDWADLDNSGEVAFEQMLLYLALDRVIKLGKILRKEETVKKYAEWKISVQNKLEKFWNEGKGAYVYSFKNGKADGVITRHPNMLAVLFDIADSQRKQIIKERVLLNSGVPPITTPYMRFYELAALCELGEYDYVMKEIRDYWGGMLSEGATSFWETYDHRQTGVEKYAMYGRRYGKSLCHAWGASPLYLIGKYFIGLTPGKTESEFILRPHLSDLDWFNAELPLAKGKIRIHVDHEKIELYSDKANGELILDGTLNICGAEAIHHNNLTTIKIKGSTNYILEIQ